MVVPPRVTPAIGSALLTAVLTPVLMSVFFPGLAAQTAPATDAKFPEGPGKTALFKVCRDCHGPESAVGQLKTHDEWNKTLDEMAANGAQGTDDEWNQILEYLDRHFSLILVNKAGATELATMLDVPRATAEAIVKYRDERGRFGAIDDLKKVPGLDAAKVEARKDRFVF
jgi:competence protein ComEA